jgi:hypothetical protein
MPFPQRKTQEINSFCLQETGNAREKKPTLRPKKSYLISPRPPVLHVDLSRHHRLQLPGPLHLLHVTAHPTITVPRCPAASAAWLSSPPPRRSALQPSAAASPRFLSSLQAVAPRRGLVPHAAAPRGARRQEAPRRGRGARRGRGRGGGGDGGGVGRGAAGVRGVDGAHAGAAEPGEARLLGGASVGGPRLLRAVHVGVRRRLRREYTHLPLRYFSLVRSCCVSSTQCYHPCTRVRVFTNRSIISM